MIEHIENGMLIAYLDDPDLPEQEEKGDPTEETIFLNGAIPKVVFQHCIESMTMDLFSS